MWKSLSDWESARGELEYMSEERRKHIGPYQRPAPPKRPLGLGASKAIQKPAVPMHEIQAQEQRLLEDIKANGNVLGLTAKVRKPGRPSVYEEPMTPAERQARRRAIQVQERGVQDALKINGGHGKSHAEVKSGGYDSTKMDTIYGLREVEENMGGRHVCPKGQSSASDEKTYGDVFNSGESSFQRGGFEQEAVQRVTVRGLRFGTEEYNRQLFASEELKKMVGEYFTLPPVDKTPSASWVARHVGNISVQRHERPSFTLTCKVCGDEMEFIEDAVDHLREDHKKIVTEWFRRLEPPREFRDMGNFVTVIMPRKRQSLKDQRVNNI
jgi:hypothetical protein